MAFYRRASAKVMELLREFSDRVEVAGLDEAYLDLSDCPAPKARARQLKQRMRDLVARIGEHLSSPPRATPAGRAT